MPSHFLPYGGIVLKEIYNCTFRVGIYSEQITYIWQIIKIHRRTKYLNKNPFEYRAAVYNENKKAVPIDLFKSSDYLNLMQV